MKEIDDIDGEQPVNRFIVERKRLKVGLNQAHPSGGDGAPVTRPGLPHHDSRLIDADDMASRRESRQGLKPSSGPAPDLKNVVVPAYIQPGDRMAIGRAVGNRHQMAGNAAGKPMGAAELPAD